MVMQEKRIVQGSLEWNMRYAGRMHYECIRNEMHKRGLEDVSHPHMLFMLLNTGEKPLTQRELSDRMGVKPATVATSLSRMEQHGLLRRVPDVSDRRKKHVELTQKGRASVEACVSAFRDIDNAMFHGFSEEEKEILKGYFVRIRRNLADTGLQNAETVPIQGGTEPAEKKPEEEKA